jgi:hydrogenase-4 membrane subunit HyfE
MKLYLFLRSLIWTSIFSVIAAIAALITAFISTSPNLPISLGLGSIALAILSPRREF